MRAVTKDDLKPVYVSPPTSHKGQNGKLLIIGGSHLFHAASLWALEVASRIVDLVHYSSVPENNEIVSKLKVEFRDGIIVPRQDVGAYIEEDDCVLIGPGMMRDEETLNLANKLLKKYPHKQWVIDAGALQMMDASLIPQNAILTPHPQEFAGLWQKHQAANAGYQQDAVAIVDQVKLFAKQHQCIVLLKGKVDLVCSGGSCDARFRAPGECRRIEGGNAGMTKGGTGDVLAGLVAALACKNDPFLATIAGSFINKQAGDELYEKVGPFFNASDLAKQIPQTMKRILLPEAIASAE